ncbi:hypothetical protein ONE63_003466 [Megalurothrips usitatus]|uniref:MULE transposase domain-containing protein n=1 Tax=Megalurothrips usitatus TaxID=439358 RepID=A0AAV7X836_9NEOP|nr:hypothetical protein ONE63_003466 [Megalurothrips usitatus]
MYAARASKFPETPHTLADLHAALTDSDSDFVRDNARHADGELLCQGVVGPAGHQSVIFASKAMFNVLLAAAWVFIDGTFSARPDNPASRQLLVISALHLGCLFPVAYVLMDSKDAVAYHHLFGFLKELVPGLNPKNIVTDFEAALVGPIADAFPTTRHQGCWFHFCQALYRRIRSTGLLQFVRENGQAAQILRMCYVLPLLPWNRILEGLNAVETIARLNSVPQMLPFLDYVRETWLGRIGAKILSVYNSIHRTNNFSESNHKRFQDKVKVKRPGIWSFIIADLLRVRENRRLQRVKEAKWVRQDARVSSALRRLESGERTLVEFLLEAQNSTKALQDHQFHVVTSLEDEFIEELQYPAPLPLIEEYDADDGPFRVNVTAAEPDQDEQGPSQAQPASPARSQPASQPLLLPPVDADFTLGVLQLQAPTVGDSVAAVPEPESERSPPSRDAGEEPGMSPRPTPCDSQLLDFYLPLPLFQISLRRPTSAVSALALMLCLQ